MGVIYYGLPQRLTLSVWLPQRISYETVRCKLLVIIRRRLASDPTLRAQFGRAGRARAEEVFGLTRYRQGLLDEYARLGQPAGRPQSR